MNRLTFDNLGEAADLERGRWPADAPLGRHASVTRAFWFIRSRRAAFASAMAASSSTGTFGNVMR